MGKRGTTILRGFLALSVAVGLTACGDGGGPTTSDATSPSDATSGTATTGSAGSAAPDLAPCDLATLDAVTAAVHAHIDPDPIVTQGHDIESLCSFNVDQADDVNGGYIWGQAEGITAFVIEVTTGATATRRKGQAPAGERLDASNDEVEVTWTVCPEDACGGNMFAQGMLFVDGGDGAIANVAFVPMGPEDDVRAIATAIAEAARDALA